MVGFVVEGHTCTYIYGIRNGHALPLHHRKHGALDRMLTYWCLWLPMMKIFITMISRISIQNKKDGGGLEQLLYCQFGHALQHNSDMFGMYCERDIYVSASRAQMLCPKS